MEGKAQEPLRPCPFCGSSTLTVKRNMDLDGMTFIVCEPCGAVASFCGAEQLAPAIEAWNTRSPVVSCDGVMRPRPVVTPNAGAMTKEHSNEKRT